MKIEFSNLNATFILKYLDLENIFFSNVVLRMKFKETNYF